MMEISELANWRIGELGPARSQPRAFCFTSPIHQLTNSPISVALFTVRPAIAG